MTQSPKHGTIAPNLDFLVSQDGYARIVYDGYGQIVCRLEADSIFFYSRMAKEEVEFPLELVIERLRKWRKLHAQGVEAGHPLRG